MSLEVGTKVEGKITGLAKFGAFVDIGGNKTGLVHISEVSDKFVEDINEELKVGQVITVEILSIADDGKIALSMRDREKEAAEKKEEKKFEKPAFKKASPARPTSPRSQQQQRSRGNHANSRDFDSLMDDFIKDSETRLSSLRKNTESKRGGRGGRRN